MFQAAVHLGDVWHGDTARRATGGDVQSNLFLTLKNSELSGDVQSSDRADQHRVSPALVEGNPCAQGEPARFCDGRQR